MRVSFSLSVFHTAVGVGGGRWCRRGFTLVEVAMTLVVLGVLVAILVVAGDRTRRTAMLGEDLSNMRQIATLTGQYAADNKDLFWTFSWQGGEIYNSKHPDYNYAPTDMEASANQAIVILKDSGRPDITKIAGWYCHLMYSHLPLLQYAGLEFPNRLFISSGDQARQLWASDPFGFDQGKFLPNQPTPSVANKRWPYSSSYQMSSSFFDQAIASIDRVSQTGTENGWYVPNTGDLRARTMSETVFPSQKVHLHDKYAWHFGTTIDDTLNPGEFLKGVPFYAEPHARLPLLFVDGHALLGRGGDGNAGWVPTQPKACTTATTFASPSSGKLVPGRYRWTRGFLDGRDVGGPEVGDCLK